MLWFLECFVLMPNYPSCGISLQGQLVTLLDDNSLHLWKLKKSSDGLSMLKRESHFELKGQPG